MTRSRGVNIDWGLDTYPQVTSILASNKWSNRRDRTYIHAPANSLREETEVRTASGPGPLLSKDVPFPRACNHLCAATPTVPETLGAPAIKPTTLASQAPRHSQFHVRREKPWSTLHNVNLPEFLMAMCGIVFHLPVHQNPESHPSFNSPFNPPPHGAGVCLVAMTILVCRCGSVCRVPNTELAATEPLLLG